MKWRRKARECKSRLATAAPPVSRIEPLVASVVLVITISHN